MRITIIAVPSPAFDAALLGRLQFIDCPQGIPVPLLHQPSVQILDCPEAVPQRGGTNPANQGGSESGARYIMHSGQQASSRFKGSPLILMKCLFRHFDTFTFEPP